MTNYRLKPKTQQSSNYYNNLPQRNPTGPEKPASANERIARPGVNVELFNRYVTDHTYSNDMGVRCAYTPRMP